MSETCINSIPALGRQRDRQRERGRECLTNIPSIDWFVLAYITCTYGLNCFENQALSPNAAAAVSPTVLGEPKAARALRARRRDNDAVPVGEAIS